MPQWPSGCTARRRSLSISIALLPEPHLHTAAGMFILLPICLDWKEVKHPAIDDDGVVYMGAGGRLRQQQTQALHENSLKFREIAMLATSHSLLRAWQIQNSDMCMPPHRYKYTDASAFSGRCIDIPDNWSKKRHCHKARRHQQQLNDTAGSQLRSEKCLPSRACSYTLPDPPLPWSQYAVCFCIPRCWGHLQRSQHMLTQALHH